MSTPTPADVAAFLGKGNDARTTALAEAHLTVIMGLASGYTRGQGFAGEIPADLAAVLIAATARYVANPQGTEMETAGPMTIRKGSFKGWTLAELSVLDRYRKRAY